MIVSAIVFALLLGLFVFGVLPRQSGRRRYVSVGVFIALVAVVYGGTIEVMSKPKPVSLEWRDVSEAKVLGASLREGEAIYVWLEIEGADAPLAYELPWSQEAAQQLQGAMSAAAEMGTAVAMTQPFDSGLDDREPKFYATPQPAMPVKDYAAVAEGDGPIEYVQPDSE
jgi:hypothetical protein